MALSYDGATASKVFWTICCASESGRDVRKSTRPFLTGYTLPHREQVNESPFRARSCLQLGQKGENNCMPWIVGYGQRRMSNLLCYVLPFVKYSISGDEGRLAPETDEN